MIIRPLSPHRLPGCPLPVTLPEYLFWPKISQTGPLMRQTCSPFQFRTRGDKRSLQKPTTHCQLQVANSDTLWSKTVASAGGVGLTGVIRGHVHNQPLADAAVLTVGAHCRNLDRIAHVDRKVLNYRPLVEEKQIFICFPKAVSQPAIGL